LTFNPLKRRGVFLQKVHLFSQKLVSQKDSKPNLSNLHADPSSESENSNIPDFISRTKLVFDEIEIQAGVIKDETAKGGILLTVVCSNEQHLAFTP